MLSQISRQLVLALCAAATLFAVPAAHAQQPKPTRRILAIGGATYANQALPKYVIALTGKKDPVIL